MTTFYARCPRDADNLSKNAFIPIRAAEGGLPRFLELPKKMLFKKPLNLLYKFMMSRLPRLIPRSPG